MRIDFNVLGLDKLTALVKQFNSKLSVTPATSNSASANPMAFSMPQGFGSPGHRDFLKQWDAHLRYQKSLGVGGVRVNGAIQPIGVVQSAIAAQLAMYRTFPGASKSPQVNLPTANQLARLLGASSRFIQNQAPHQFSGMIMSLGANGPLGTALAATVALLTSFGAALLSGSQSLNRYSANMTAAIADPRQASMLQQIARSIGIDPSQLSGAAANRPGGAQQLLEQIRYVLSEKDSTNRQRLYRSMDLPPELENIIRIATDKSGNIDQSRINDMLSGVGYGRSQEQLNKAAKTQELLGKVAENWEKLKGNFLDNFTSALKPDKPSDLLLVNPMVNVAKSIYDLFNNGKDKDDASRRMERAVDRLTKSIEDAYSWTDKRGTFGGIDPVRASNAYPQNWAWSHERLREQNIADTTFLGAFPIS